MMSDSKYVILRLTIKSFYFVQLIGSKRKGNNLTPGMDSVFIIQVINGSDTTQQHETSSLHDLFIPGILINIWWKIGCL